MWKTKQGTVLVTLLALAACDTPGEPELLADGVLNEDVAMVAADAALGDLAAMALGGAGTGGVPALSTAPPSRTRTVEFYDADGNLMDAFDALLTDRVHVVVEVSGEVSRDNWSGVVERQRDLTVSGLAGEETVRTWNGTSSGYVTRSRHSDEHGDRTREMSERGTIESVVVAVDRSAQPWPLSGTITRHVKVKLTGPAGELEREREVVIVFNGTRYPEMTVNGESFELDLGATGPQRPFRRHRNRGGRG